MLPKKKRLLVFFTVVFVCMIHACKTVKSRAASLFFSEPSLSLSKTTDNQDAFEGDNIGHQVVATFGVADTFGHSPLTMLPGKKKTGVDIVNHPVVLTESPATD